MHVIVRRRRGAPPRASVRAPGAYGYLLILIAALLIATALAGRSAVGQAGIVILQGGVLLFAVWTSHSGAGVLRWALVVVPAIVVAAATLTGSESDYATATVSAAGAVLALGAIGAVARRILAHPRVNGETILGALCVYLTRSPIRAPSTSSTSVL
jgi:hypothetical protein